MPTYAMLLKKVHLKHQQMAVQEIWDITKENFVVLLPSIVLGVFGYLYFAKKENVYQRSMRFTVIALVVAVSAIMIWSSFEMRRNAALLQQKFGAPLKQKSP